MFGNGAPYLYDHANRVISENRPGTVHTQNTALYQFFRRYLLQKAISVFRWKLPSTWSRDYFLYVLYCWGVVAIVETDKYGVIPQGCGLEGYNVFYQPRKAIIANPLLRGLRDPIIGEECVLFKLQPDFGGIMDLVNYYAEELALCSESVSVNLLNSKMSYVFAAANKAGAESLKALYDSYASGQPAVFYDKNLIGDDGKPTWDMFSQNVGENYIADKVLSDMRKIEAMFDTDIGIPNANTDKRERLVTDEVNANNVETYSKCALWLESLQKGCTEVREMFGVDMSVDWRVNPVEREITRAEEVAEGES